MSESVPAIIHQTFFDKNNLPVEIKNNIRKLCIDNPEWRYVLYDDSDIENKILQHYGLDILKIYRKINPEYGAARADFFRYLILYAEGGVYLDIKSSLTKPLRDILRKDEKFILSKWKNGRGNEFENWGLHPELESFPGGEYQQWYIVSSRGHLYLRTVIESVIRNIQEYNLNQHGVGKPGVLRVTGPIVYTLAIESVKSDSLNRFVDDIEYIGFQRSIYKEKYKHEVLFRKHYASLETPLIKSGGLKYFFNFFIYKFVKKTKKFDKKIKIRLKKIRKLF